MEIAKIECSKDCILVKDKEAELVKSFVFLGNYLVINKPDGSPIDGGKINLNEQIYTILFYDKLKIISLVIKKPSPCAITLVFRSSTDYDDIFDVLKISSPNTKFSRQNFKISSYANNIAAKLADGVELAVVDTVDKTNVKLCPECGMEIQPGAMYCMDCGAELI